MEVLREVLLLEPGYRPAKVVLVEIVNGFVLAGQHPPTEGRVGHRGDSQFTAGLQKAGLGLFNVHGERAVLDLIRVDLVDLARTP